MALTALLDLVFPRVCGGCGTDLSVDRGHVCWDCRASLRTIGPPHCALCGNPVEGRVDHEYTCWHCADTQPCFDRARSAVLFDGAAAGLIREFKYHGGVWLQDELVDLLEACARYHYLGETFDAVCAVPLHPLRRRERGYNQAALLAAGLARRMGLPLRDPLRRRAPTGTQTRLTARQRISNVRGAFEAGRIAAEPLRWLLVDDVMTTGATVSECARTLKEKGAARVCAVTVARGS